MSTSMSLRTARRRAAAVAVALLLGAVTAGPAAAGLASGPAPAPQSTNTDGNRCSDHAGTIQSRVVEGDLLVDVRCTLRSVLVRGDLVLLRGGRLHLYDTTVDGDVAGAASVDLFDSLVRGGVTLGGGGYRVYGEGSSVRRSVRTEAGGVRLVNSSVGGALNVAAKQQPEDWVVLHRTTVAGWVSMYGGNQLVLESRLGKGLTATGWNRDLGICASTVAGDVTLRGGHSPAAICDPSAPTEIGGSLTVRGSTHRVDLTALTVGGDLSCTGNTGRVTVAADVTVQGSRTGQCAP